MDSFFNMVVKPVLYWLTVRNWMPVPNRKINPPRYLLVWLAWGVGSGVFFAIGSDLKNESLMTVFSILLVLWGLVLLAFIGWLIRRRINFIKFKRQTQVKDDAFTVEQLSSAKKLRPKDLKGAG